MLRYLKEEEKKLTEALYREAFYEDKDTFVTYYYDYVTRNNRILVAEQAGEICSMIHLNPYRLWVNGTLVDAYYYVAVATKEKYRRRGMMKSLLEKSFHDLHKEGMPFVYLMPADRAIYEPFDFRIVYRQEPPELLEDVREENERKKALFDIFTYGDARYAERIREEKRICEGEEPSEFVPYIMMRILHVEKMLELLRSESPIEILLSVQDEILPENDGKFYWRLSPGDSVCRKWEAERGGEQRENSLPGKGVKEISLTIGHLTEFVFGKRRVEGLEKIRVLKRICINEIV